MLPSNLLQSIIEQSSNLNRNERQQSTPQVSSRDISLCDFSFPTEFLDPQVSAKDEKYYRRLLDRGEQQTLIQELNVLEQKNPREFEMARNSAFVAAIDRRHGKRQYLEFARYLIKDRGHNDVS